MTVQELWDIYHDTPTEEDEEGSYYLHEPFLHFPIGTLVTDVSYWFEETFKVRVYNLMNLNATD